ncbi:MAG: MFS transporter [Deltaproteobacteria bacterium]|nr:MFS transporter [Candidatus Zymogenaceae bacterium]
MKPTAITSYLSILCYGMCITIIGPALGAVGETFLLSPARLGLFTTMLSAGFIPAVLLGGYIVDRYGVQAVGLAGQLLLTAGFILFSVTTSFPVALFAFFILGIAGGNIEIVANTVVSGLYPHKRASALNLLHAFFGIGALAGPVISGAFIDSGAPWQAGYWVLAIISAAVLVLMVFSPFPRQVASEKVDFSDFLTVARTPAALVLGAAIILYIGAEMGINYWSALHLTQRYAVSALAAGSFLSYFWVAMTAGRFLVFMAAKKIGDRLLLFILTALSLAAYALFLIADRWWLSGIGLTLVGLFFSGIFPTALGLGVNRFSRIPGTITGFLMMFNGIGMLIFPYIVGLITDAASLSAGMSFIMAILACLTVLTAAIALQRRPKDSAPGRRAA